MSFQIFAVILRSNETPRTNVMFFRSVLRPPKDPFARGKMTDILSIRSLEYSNIVRSNRSWLAGLHVQLLTFIFALSYISMAIIASNSLLVLIIPITIILLQLLVMLLRLFRITALFHLITIPLAVGSLLILYVSENTHIAPILMVLMTLCQVTVLQTSPCPFLSLGWSVVETTVAFGFAVFLTGSIGQVLPYFFLSLFIVLFCAFNALALVLPNLSLRNSQMKTPMYDGLETLLADKIASAARFAKPSRDQLIGYLQRLQHTVGDVQVKNALKDAVKGLSGHNMVVPLKEMRKVSHETLRFLDTLGKHTSFAPGSGGHGDISQLHKTPTNLTTARSMNSAGFRTSYGNIVSAIGARGDSWDFDAFDLEARHPRFMLVGMAYRSIQALGLMGEFGIDHVRLNSLLLAIEAGYYDNEYHSATHATDVVQGVYWLLSDNGGKFGELLTDLEKFALIFSAAIHDYGHIGVNNAFISNCEGPLSIRYSDRSNLEAFSIACVFQIMAQPEYQLIEDKATRMAFRQMVISIVMATDMARHNIEVTNFKEKLASGAFTAPITEAEDRLLLMNLIMKAADVSNPARPRPVYLAWTERVVTEFFVQGDAEKQLNHAVGQNNDRDTLVMAESQRGFMAFVTKPLFGLLRDIAPDPSALEQVFENLQANHDYWSVAEADVYTLKVKTKTQFKTNVDDAVRRARKPLEQQHVTRFEMQHNDSFVETTNAVHGELLMGRQKQQEAQRRAMQVISRHGDLVKLMKPTG
ncbi:3'5'-cyclic nucleotide phosphodiesterase [Carpediemonas membranifera]|uniref:Phosphodiesterase n=1 Tax=Carpediemonas membranifera TaxID=201153 RepID=A0A8J6E4V1_9EUKA|nr:3'5'-cyclic nucleotide phosphodiesterase [Carpediemonas membranifera]|eukprot:KAG9397391.1 3'5'-cyclic nucleotide phosphodiesterase [Carpediemonas membranifera]